MSRLPHWFIRTEMFLTHHVHSPSELYKEFASSELPCSWMVHWILSNDQIATLSSINILCCTSQWNYSVWTAKKRGRTGGFSGVPQSKRMSTNCHCHDMQIWRKCGTNGSYVMFRKFTKRLTYSQGEMVLNYSTQNYATEKGYCGLNKRTCPWCPWPGAFGRRKKPIASLFHSITLEALRLFYSFSGSLCSSYFFQLGGRARIWVAFEASFDWRYVNASYDELRPRTFLLVCWTFQFDNIFRQCWNVIDLLFKII